MNNINLTNEQSEALGVIKAWFKNNEGLDEPTHQTLTLGGYAGTGKTTLLKFLAEELSKKHLSFMSFTGKAAAVMRSKMPGFNPTTIHSFMYRAITDANGVVVDWEHKRMQDSPSELFEHTIMAPYSDLIVIDEASMVPRDIYENLLTYNKPILAIGDHGQLPPIGDPFSLMTNPDIRLEEIHRQAEDNPIIKLATDIRTGKFHKNSQLKKINFTGSEAESLVSSPSPETLFITPTNKERVQFNKAILMHLRGEVPKKPVKGDRLICLKNNHQLGIYNGMTCEVIEERKCNNFPEHNYHYIIKPDGYTSNLQIDMTKYTFLGGKIPSPIEVPFYEIKNHFDYAYALTCHKAQGSEANNVVIWGTGFGRDQEFRKRWLYTAVTRAKENVWIFV